MYATPGGHIAEITYTSAVVAGEALYAGVRVIGVAVVVSIAVGIRDAIFASAV